MKTVKEFKDLGVVFVVGDQGDQYSVGEANGLNANSAWDSSAPESFAWRPLNTLPDNPKFKYETSAQLMSWRPSLDQSQTETPEEKEAFDKMKPYDFDEHASNAKPVFTQAMADAEFKAGDFVSVLPPKGVRQSKSKFLLVGFDIDGHAVIQHSCSKAISIESKTYLIAPIDNRTPKQKAVDAAMEDIDAEADDVTKVVGVIERMIAAGYKKC